MHKTHLAASSVLHGLSADKAVDSEFKLLLARAGNVIAFCSGITVFHNFGHRYFMALGALNLGSAESRHSRAQGRPGGGGVGVAGMTQW